VLLRARRLDLGCTRGMAAGDGGADNEKEIAMADVLYLGVTLVVFGLSWLLVRLCERL